ncbi:MAG: iron hydrogenase small subunit [Blautia coccoides]
MEDGAVHPADTVSFPPDPYILKLYDEYMERPLSHKAHMLLHTEHEM